MIQASPPVGFHHTKTAELEKEQTYAPPIKIPEIFNRILANLHPKDLGNCAKVSRHFNNETQNFLKESLLFRIKQFVHKKINRITVFKEIYIKEFEIFVSIATMFWNLDIAESKKIFEKSISIVSQCSEEALKCELLYIIAKGKAKVGSPDEAKKLFSAALQQAHGIQTIPLRNSLLFRIAKACAKTGDILGARVTAYHIAQDGYLVAKALNATAKACNPVEAQIEVQKLFREALEEARGINLHYFKARALNKIAKNQAKADNPVKAQELFGEALEEARQSEQDQFKVAALCSIAKAQAKVDNLIEAKKLLEEALEVTHQITERGFSLSVIAKVQAEIGDILGAKKIASQAKDQILKDAIIKNILIVQVKRRDIPGAKKTASEMKIELPWALKYIAKGEAKTGDLSTVKDQFEKLMAGKKENVLDLAAICKICQLWWPCRISLPSVDLS